ncbi:hypothetical protein GCM10025794_30660 [Massilia kyonggiensis]|jgi:hypothetical protein
MVLNLMWKGTKASKFETLLAEMEQPMFLAKSEATSLMKLASQLRIQASAFLSA